MHIPIVKLFEICKPINSHTIYSVVKSLTVQMFIELYTIDIHSKSFYNVYIYQITYITFLLYFLTMFIK